MRGTQIYPIGGRLAGRAGGRRRKGTPSDYTGSTGSASCGPCTCGAASGASCDNALLTVGSDYTCSGATSIGSGGTACFTSGIYEPGVQFGGSPTAPTCPPQSAYTGNLTPSGPKTLCCP